MNHKTPTQAFDRKRDVMRIVTPIGTAEGDSVPLQLRQAQPVAKVRWGAKLGVVASGAVVSREAPESVIPTARNALIANSILFPWMMLIVAPVYML
jgi:hypothetical protein